MRIWLRTASDIVVCEKAWRGLRWNCRLGTKEKGKTMASTIGADQHADISLQVQLYVFLSVPDGPNDVRAFLSHASKKLGPTIVRLA